MIKKKNISYKNKSWIFALVNLVLQIGHSIILFTWAPRPPALHEEFDCMLIKQLPHSICPHVVDFNCFPCCFNLIIQSKINLNNLLLEITRSYLFQSLETDWTMNRCTSFLRLLGTFPASFGWNMPRDLVRRRCIACF